MSVCVCMWLLLLLLKMFCFVNDFVWFGFVVDVVVLWEWGGCFCCFLGLSRLLDNFKQKLGQCFMPIAVFRLS